MKTNLQLPYLHQLVIIIIAMIIIIIIIMILIIFSNLHLPSLYQPVMGEVEQTCRGWW